RGFRQLTFKFVDVPARGMIRAAAYLLQYERQRPGLTAVQLHSVAFDLSLDLFYRRHFFILLKIGLSTCDSDPIMKIPRPSSTAGLFPREHSIRTLPPAPPESLLKSFRC